MKSTFTLLLIWLLFNNCQREPVPRLTKIDGLVIDADTFKLLVGFAISISGSTGTTFSGTSKYETYAILLTDSNGRFSFSKEILPKYTVGVSNQQVTHGMIDCENQCLVFSGETVSLTLKLRKR